MVRHRPLLDLLLLTVYHTSVTLTLADGRSSVDLADADGGIRTQRSREMDPIIVLAASSNSMQIGLSHTLESVLLAQSLLLPACAACSLLASQPPA